jgi:hypothetical protein
MNKGAFWSDQSKNSPSHQNKQRKHNSLHPAMDYLRNCESSAFEAQDLGYMNSQMPDHSQERFLLKMELGSHWQMEPKSKWLADSSFPWGQSKRSLHFSILCLSPIAAVHAGNPADVLPVPPAQSKPVSLRPRAFMHTQTFHNRIQLLICYRFTVASKGTTFLPPHLEWIWCHKNDRECLLIGNLRERSGSMVDAVVRAHCSLEAGRTTFLGDDGL